MTTIRVPRIVQTRARVSSPARRACAAFGLCVQQDPNASRGYVIPPDQHILKKILTTRIVHISGASGSGKSRRLAGIERALLELDIKVHRASAFESTDIALFDAFDGSREQVCSSLSHAGLAEPRLWALPINTLSAGERARAELCHAIHNAAKGSVVLADEFCTPLDRICAYALCTTVRRWVHRKGVHFVSAGAHEDLPSLLSPDLVIDGADGSCAPNETPGRNDIIRFEEGTREDFDALSHLHYLGGHPATRTRILRATRTTQESGDILAGVLLVSMPTLNGAWRRWAWGDRYASGDKRADAIRLNEEIRYLSRVIVEPRSRGLGVASGLVRAYLADPQTDACEAIAAMGSVCPFLARAGMTQYPIAIPSANARLLDALRYLDLSAEMLTETEIPEGSLLHRELMHWARSARMLRGSDTPLRTIALMASCRLLSQPRAYAWSRYGEQDEHTTQRITTRTPQGHTQE